MYYHDQILPPDRDFLEPGPKELCSVLQLLHHEHLYLRLHLMSFLNYQQNKSWKKILSKTSKTICVIIFFKNLDFQHFEIYLYWYKVCIVAISSLRSSISLNSLRFRCSNSFLTAINSSYSNCKIKGKVKLIGVILDPVLAISNSNNYIIMP